MSDMIRALTRKNSLRSILRELSLEQIEKLMSDVKEIYDDIYSEKQAEQAAEEARQQKIIQLKALMAEAGIDLNEIVQNGVPSTKRAVKPKYRLIDSQTGKTLEWTGRGRTPVWVSEYEAKGGNREELLIQE